MKGILPEKIRKRRSKIGFATPEEKWIKEMKNMIYDIINSESFKKRKYFNHEAILEEFDKLFKNKIKYDKVLWRILNLELWLREFIDRRN